MRLIHLKIDDQEIDLSDDFNIRLTFNFPLPYRDSIPVISSYWFTLLATAKNNIIFKHSNNLYISSRISCYNCSIIIPGLTFNGLLYVKNSGSREYKTFVVFNDLSETLINKKVSEIVNDIQVLGTDTDTIIAEAKTMSQASWPDVDYAFPEIYNDQFYGDDNAEFSADGKFMNKYSSVTDKYVKNYIDANVVYNINVLVPMPYLFFILQNMFEQVGWKVTGNLFEDDNFKKLIYYNNFHLENIADQRFLYVSHNDEISLNSEDQIQLFFTEELSDENDDYDIATGEFTCSQTGTYYYTFTAILHQLHSINTHFKFYIFDGSDYTELFDQNSYSILWRTFKFSKSGYVELTNGQTYTFFYEFDSLLAFANIEMIRFQLSPESNGLNRFASNIDLKNHVPRLTTSEFLTQLMKKFSIAIFFDYVNKLVEFQTWNDIIDNDNYIDLSECMIKETEEISISETSFTFITDWSADDLIEDNFKDLSGFNSETIVILPTDLPNPSIINQIALVASLNQFYITIKNNITNELQWSAYYDNYYDIISGNKEATEIKTIINTLFMRADADMYPVISQKGSSPALGINDQGFKLLNYLGFYQFTPLASSTIYDVDGTEKYGVILKTNDIDGTYERYGKKLYEYLENNDPVEMDLHINMSQFIEISKLFLANNPVRKLRIGTKNYIPESIDITISLSKIENCKVKLL